MNAKTAIVLVVGLVVVGVAIQSRSRRGEQVRPPEQTDRLSTRRGFKPRLPAPRMPVAPASVPEAQPSGLEQTNVFARMQNNDSAVPTPNRTQVESYLAENRRSAESLLTAFRLMRDQSLLQEATAKYPNNPQVSYAGWIAARMKDDASPEECRQWLNAFKQAAPDNALANYLSAAACFKSGQTDLAVEELMAASGKFKFQDYAAETVQNLEEAYVSTGNSLVDAKAEAAYGHWTPQLRELKELGRSLGDLANRYRQTGDEASAQAVLQMGVALGQRVTEPSGQKLLTSDFTGFSIERLILDAMPSASSYDAAGHSVKDRLEEIRHEIDERKILWNEAQPILQKISENELISYFDRMKLSGEFDALRWVMNRRDNP
jgi:hypothetical protein